MKGDIGLYWESKNTNEIDIVAIDDLGQRLFLAEVKRNPEKIQLEQLRQKASKLIAQYPHYSVHFAGLSLTKMTTIPFE